MMEMEDNLAMSMRKAESQMKQNISKYWQPMRPIGEFIILLLANTFLTHDYEYCLRIGTSDFTIWSVSNIFRGNLVRYVSIASAKLFEHAMREQDDNFVDHVDFLYQSLTCAEKALDIYEAKHIPLENSLRHQISNLPYSEHQCPYGMALSNFTLAYLYDKFSQALSDERVSQIEKYENLCFGEERGAKSKANEHYALAFELFKNQNHIFGAYLSKKGELDTYTSYDDDDDNEDLDKLKIDAYKWQEKFSKYQAKNGVENSNYIIREQGEEISLMAEIVFAQHNDKFNHEHLAKANAIIMQERQRSNWESCLAKIRRQQWHTHTDKTIQDIIINHFIHLAAQLRFGCLLREEREYLLSQVELSFLRNQEKAIQFFYFSLFSQINLLLK